MKFLFAILFLAFCLLLIAVLYPVHAGSFRSKNSFILYNAREVGLSVAIYTGDFNDDLPPFSKVQPPSTFLYPYLKQNKLAEIADSYHWRYRLASVDVGSIESPESTWLFHGDKLERNRSFLGYADGKFKMIDFDVLPQIATKPIVFKHKSHGRSKQ